MSEDSNIVFHSALDKLGMSSDTSGLRLVSLRAG